MPRFEVTQEHIDGGVQLHPNHCPLAQALEGLAPEGWAVEVRGRLVQRVSPDGREELIALLEEDLMRWAGDFDDGKKVRPVTVEIEGWSARIAEGPKQGERE